MFAAKLDLTPTLINERQHHTRNYKRHEEHQSNVENTGREHRLIFGRSPRTLEPAKPSPAAVLEKAPCPAGLRHLHLARRDHFAVNVDAYHHRPPAKLSQLTLG